MAVAATHNEDAYRGGVRQTGVVSLQRPIEPSKMEIPEGVERGAGAELDVAGVRQIQRG